MKWANKIDISKYWEEAKANRDQFNEMTTDFASKLKNLDATTTLSNYVWYELEDIIERLDSLKRDDFSTFDELKDEFDGIMDEIYDIADGYVNPNTKFLWIDTF